MWEGRRVLCWKDEFLAKLPWIIHSVCCKAAHLGWLWCDFTWKLQYFVFLQGAVEERGGCCGSADDLSFVQPLCVGLISSQEVEWHATGLECTSPLPNSSPSRVLVSTLRGERLPPVSGPVLPHRWLNHWRQLEEPPRRRHTLLYRRGVVNSITSAPVFIFSLHFETLWHAGRVTVTFTE